MHRLDVALAILACLFVAIVAYLVLQVSRDRIAAALFVPYAVWAGFAALLNEEIWRLN
jgi:tryptophan-rich sensory protein